MSYKLLDTLSSRADPSPDGGVERSLFLQKGIPPLRQVEITSGRNDK